MAKKARGKRLTNVAKYLVEASHCIGIVMKKDGAYGADSVKDLGSRMRFADIHRKYKRLKHQIWNGFLVKVIARKPQNLEAEVLETLDDWRDIGNYAFLAIPVFLQEFLGKKYKKSELKEARTILLKAAEELTEIIGDVYIIADPSEVVTMDMATGNGHIGTTSPTQNLKVFSEEDMEKETKDGYLEGIMNRDEPTEDEVKDEKALTVGDMEEDIAEAAFTVAGALSIEAVVVKAILLKAYLGAGAPDKLDNGKLINSAYTLMEDEDLKELLASKGFKSGSMEADIEVIMDLALKELGIVEGESVSDKIEGMVNAEEGTLKGNETIKPD